MSVLDTDEYAVELIKDILQVNMNTIMVGRVVGLAPRTGFYLLGRGKLPTTHTVSNMSHRMDIHTSSHFAVCSLSPMCKILLTFYHWILQPNTLVTTAAAAAAALWLILFSTKVTVHRLPIISIMLLSLLQVYNI